MQMGSIYGCLTVLDMGEEYFASQQYLTCKEEYDSMQKELERYKSVTTEAEKKKAIEELPSSSFMSDLKENPSDIDRIFGELADYKQHRILEDMKRLKNQMAVHYKCKCKCGKNHYYDEKTIESAPKYCYYPMFISSRMTYSVAAQNATYNKRKKYGDLMNVVFVDKRTDCKPSDEYCGLWNDYKQKQKKSTSSAEKRYTVKEWSENHKKCVTHEIYATSHLEALKKLYPNDDFELCPQSDIRNRMMFWGSDYEFEVSNHYGNSAQNRSRRYKRTAKK